MGKSYTGFVAVGLNVLNVANFLINLRYEKFLRIMSTCMHTRMYSLMEINILGLEESTQFLKLVSL